MKGYIIDETLNFPAGLSLDIVNIARHAGPANVDVAAGYAKLADFFLKEGKIMVAAETAFAALRSVPQNNLEHKEYADVIIEDTRMVLIMTADAHQWFHQENSGSFGGAMLDELFNAAKSREAGDETGEALANDWRICANCMVMASKGGFVKASLKKVAAQQPVNPTLRNYVEAMQVRLTPAPA